MAKYMVTENEVKTALDIDSFRNMSKEKIIEFVSAIPNMDKDVAIKIIEQFPAYTESANIMLAQLNTLCNNAMKENGESQKEAIEAYKKILDDLGELLKKDTITAEERMQITEQMITVADRISAKDTENKEFLNGIIKYGVPIIGGALVLGATILGVNVKGTKIPTLKK
ncbi:putative membrane protein [Caldibacillus thermoamylovorans]|jgi:hypothetical protein|uniref:Putative membrane protein n=1 Tax=Caldibacillus thermoamylovorans TaxID=35841 RepID=A0A090ISP6_9BACI|nr:MULTISPECIES: hypothetical protein [Bacillaceae]MEC5273960.1 hypothetical protein [Caldifermentibacillus hisashii]CEE00702.1 putative membrane protein [Caldibacillus thermoamylovorans]